ncbi:MAG TPA: DUF4097 family beta strand repeat-containing protein [Acidimicrobiia bacterium]|nr:DUF4097 family beta strand repeat-containing protein [Acidimicrobiia bacterium]
MSERMERFEIAGRPRLVLRVPAGDVRVVAGKPGEAVVRCRADERHLSRVVIDRDGDTINVGPEGAGFGHWPSLELEIAVGAPPDVRARFGSTDVELQTAAHSLELAGASGDVVAGAVEGSLTVRLASGDLAVESVGGPVDVVTASGDVRLRQAGGQVEVKTASGNIALGTVEGDCTARTASGRVAVARFNGGRFEGKTVSGNVRLGVPSGRRYSLSLQTLSGDMRTDFPVSGEAGGSPGRIAVTSVSGDIRIAAAGEA